MEFLSVVNSRGLKLSIVEQVYYSAFVKLNNETNVRITKNLNT